MRPSPRKLLAAGLVLGLAPALAACGGGGSEVVKTGEGDTAAAVDTEPPVIEHVPVEGSQIIDNAVEIVAVVTDVGEGLDVVRIYHRTNVETEHTEQEMSAEGEGRWVGTIPAAAVTNSKVFYYIWALDKAGNEAEFPGAGNELSFGVTTR